MTILMKVTSRGRPHILKQTIDKYISLANNTQDMIWVLSLDLDDPELSTYVDLLPWINICINEPSNKITAINSNVHDEGWDILLNISDDQVPIVKGYDDIIRKSMPADLDASLWFFDGWQRRINTQEILGYNYYKRLGYIYYPEYKSFFCDNEATIVSGSKLINQCIIRHDHPLWNKQSHVPHDQLYKTNDKYWQHDEQLFNKRKQTNFT